MAAAAASLWCLVVCYSLILTLVVSQNPHKRFEYKFSFKPPYLAQKDGSVPFWDYFGNAIASEESVRITPSLRSQKGSVWTKNPSNFEWWEIEFIFRVTGRGRIGADGLAFWYTEEKGQDGPVFGSNDKWKGLGVFFDSFDNDNKHNNPYIMAMVNDGTKIYNHQQDGMNQQLAGCLRDFRNKPFSVRARIEYYKNTLTVMFHSGMSNSEKDYELCLRAENVFLPKYGYFGLSAATGGLADDHDALRFILDSLRPPELALVPDDKITDDEKRKLSQEFQQYQEKLDKQKEEYRKEHPDVKKDEVEDPENWYESDQQRELRQIFMGQSQMFDVLRELHRKMDEIVGRQERTLSLISTSQMNAVQGGVPAHPQPVGGQVPVFDTIRRDEVNALLNNQREIVATGRELKAFVTEIHQKSGSILQNQARQPSATAQVQPVGYDIHAVVNEMKEGLNIMKRDIGITAQKVTSQQPCAAQQTPACVSTTVFIVFMVIQLILMIGYIMYRDNKEAQAKKFY